MTDHKRLDGELDLAMLALQSGKTRAQRRAAFERMRELKAKQAADPELVAALEKARGLRR